MNTTATVRITGSRPHLLPGRGSANRNFAGIERPISSYLVVERVFLHDNA
jgi:hypothetical protein